MFNLSAKEFSDKYYCCTELKIQSNNYYRLDCESGIGVINPLLNELKRNFIDLKEKSKKQRKEEFEFYLEFFLKKCININQSFSDAVLFLSIWLELSPDTLLNERRDKERTKFRVEEPAIGVR